MDPDPADVRSGLWTMAQQTDAHVVPAHVHTGSFFNVLCLWRADDYLSFLAPPEIRSMAASLILTSSGMMTVSQCCHSLWRLGVVPSVDRISLMVKRMLNKVQHRSQSNALNGVSSRWGITTWRHDVASRRGVTTWLHDVTSQRGFTAWFHIVASRRVIATSTAGVSTRLWLTHSTTDTYDFSTWVTLVAAWRVDSPVRLMLLTHRICTGHYVSHPWRNHPKVWRHPTLITQAQ